MQTKQDIVSEYRKLMPSMPTSTLAKLIYKEDNNKLLFKNAEDVRGVLRTIEGKMGANHLKRLKDKSLVIENPRPLNPYKLPDSDEKYYNKYIISPDERLGLMGDIHVPFHSISALTAAIKYLKNESITTLILAGDFFDFYGLSRWIKDPRQRNVSEELNLGCQLIETLRDEFNCKIILKEGNHESRLNHYLWNKQADIFSIAELKEIKEINLLNLINNRLSVRLDGFVPSNQIMNYRGLNILHGHELPSGLISPVNIARGLYLRTKSSSMCFHSHRTSEHTEQDIDNRLITCWSVGCLSDLHPEYAPINSYNHGFAIISPQGEGFSVKNIRIRNGIIY